MRTYIVVDAENADDLEVILNRHQEAKVVGFQHEIWFEETRDGRERFERYTVILEDES